MQQGDPRVAVVVITHNRRDELARTLGHLTALPARPPIVAVDNGSTDGTAEMVARQFPQVELLLAGGNLGAAGRTLGICHVRNSYVALCDDDTWWEPESLRHAADLMDAHPRLAVLVGKVLVGPENREDSICAELERSPLPVEPGMPGKPLLGFLAGAVLVRRDAFLEVRGFDARPGIGGEEEWVAVELAARGWWICYVPTVIIHHYPSPRRDGPGRRRQMIRNALWFSWLRRPLVSAVRRTLWLARSVPRDRVSLAGFVSAFARLPWLLRERRLVPPEVERCLRLLDPAPVRRRARRSAVSRR